VARNIDLLDYDGQRLALLTLGVEVRVWSTDHRPRYEIKMLPDAAPMPISDPRLASDGALSVGHVDGYTHRDCARPGGHREGRL
jgi:hypothetical protein